MVLVDLIFRFRPDWLQATNTFIDFDSREAYDFLGLHLGKPSCGFWCNWLGETLEYKICKDVQACCYVSRDRTKITKGPLITPPLLPNLALDVTPWGITGCFLGLLSCSHAYAQLRPTLCNLMDSPPARLLCPLSFLGKSTGVGCHFLLQGIFLTQGSNVSFIGRQMLYH